MAYLCKDCTYRGVTSGQAGECPACGSFNMVRSEQEEEEAPPPRWRLQVLLVVWAVLALVIGWKIIN